jgi:hypothetical protein
VGGPERFDSFTVRCGVVAEAFNSTTSDLDVEKRTKFLINTENLKVQYFDGSADKLHIRTGPMFEPGEIISSAYEGSRHAGVCNHSTGNTLTFYKSLGVYILSGIILVFWLTYAAFIQLLQIAGVQTGLYWVGFIVAFFYPLYQFEVRRRANWEQRMNKLFLHYNERLKSEIRDPAAAWERARAARRAR